MVRWPVCVAPPPQFVVSIHSLLTQPPAFSNFVHSKKITMQPDAGEAQPQETAKRMRRPSVRLHQPYYENPGHRKLQQQWNANKGPTPPRKPRTVKDNNKDALNERIKGGGSGNLDFEDDVVIGNWRNFSAANRDRDFKRKRVRSSNCPAKSRRDGPQEIGNFPLSSFGESEQRQQEQQEREEEEEDLGVNGGIDSNLAVEDSNPSHSFDSHNVVRNQQSNELIKREVSNGVRMWLNDLGLGKYVGLFEMHGVDDEVLPLLTLEDLKEMGINEVGVRRKMYSSIQKLHKWFR